MSTLKRMGKRVLRMIPQIDRLYQQVENQWVPPGHFYSPIPDLSEIRRREQQIFTSPPSALPAIDLNVEGQLRQLEVLSPFAAEQPFGTERGNGKRYRYGNGMYDYLDGLFLHCMIRWARPRRIVEVGSGNSSCVILDTVEGFLDNGVDCTFIEPYPDVLQSLLRPGDEERIHLVPNRFQDVAREQLLDLGPQDMLVIDSTHVSKTDSDVNHLFFDVLPGLAPGVLVHIHDVFYPLEYRRDWVFEGRAWNELYVLRAFLEYNAAFRILLFVDYLRIFQWDRLKPLLPAEWDVTGWDLGSSLWLQKVGNS